MSEERTCAECGIRFSGETGMVVADMVSTVPASMWGAKKMMRPQAFCCAEHAGTFVKRWVEGCAEVKEGVKA